MLSKLRKKLELGIRLIVDTLATSSTRKSPDPSLRKQEQAIPEIQRKQGVNEGVDKYEVEQEQEQEDEGINMEEVAKMQHACKFTCERGIEACSPSLPCTPACCVTGVV